MDNRDIVVTAFYHFTNIEHPQALIENLQAFCNEQDLKGTILVAYEGINSTISGKRENIDNLYKYLTSIDSFKELKWKESYATEWPFERMKVKFKKEIVTMGILNLDMSIRGEYIDPEAWDDFISREDVTLIDTRNSYETEIGTFKGSVDPNTNKFIDFPAWVEKNLTKDKNANIAMCCTGGIRCEKSTAYLKSLGYKNVYHLKGGILEYFARTKNKNDKWEGDCFIFDNRICLDVNLE